MTQSPYSMLKLKREKKEEILPSANPETCEQRTAPRPMARPETSTNLSGGVESRHAGDSLKTAYELTHAPWQGTREGLAISQEEQKLAPPLSGSSAPPAQNNTRVQFVSPLIGASVSSISANAECRAGADQQRRIAGARTPTVKTQALPRSDADETGGVTAGETALLSRTVMTYEKQGSSGVSSAGGNLHESASSVPLLQEQREKIKNLGVPGDVS